MPYGLTGTITTTINGAASVETVDPGRASPDRRRRGGPDVGLDVRPTGRSSPNPRPGSPVAAFTYDANGREASVTVGTGSTARTTTYAYDPKTGNATVTRPDGSDVELGVDAHGDIAAVTADGSTTVDAYDAIGRLDQLQPAGGA